MSRLTGNVLITTLAKIIKIFAGLATSILIARLYGPEGQGVFRMAIFLPALLVTIGSFGLGPSTIYLINKDKNNESLIIKNSYTIGIIWGMVLLLIAQIIIRLFGTNLFPNIPLRILILASYAIPFLFLGGIIGHVFLGKSKVIYYNAYLTLNALLFLLFIIITHFLFRKSFDNIIYSYIGSALVVSTILVILYYSNFHIYKLGLNRSFIKSATSFGLLIFLGNIINYLHYRIDSYFLNYMLDPHAVGIYAIAVILTEKTWILSQAVSEILFPKLSGLNDPLKAREYTIFILKIVFLITAVIFILFQIIAKPLILLLFGNDFFPSILPFRILLFGATGISLWRVIVQYYYSIKSFRAPLIIGAGALILNMTLNYLLIPKYQILGAAISTMVTYCLTFLALFYSLYITYHLKPSQVFLFTKDEMASINIAWSRIKSRLNL